jgi:hypothetical protein
MPIMREILCVIQAHAAHCCSSYDNGVVIRKDIMYVRVMMLARGLVFYECEEGPEVRRRKESLVGATFRIWYLSLAWCLVVVWLLLFGQVFGGWFFERESWRSW